jgi:hypothetical protein
MFPEIDREMSGSGGWKAEAGKRKPEQGASILMRRHINLSEKGSLEVLL